MVLVNYMGVLSQEVSEMIFFFIFYNVWGYSGVRYMGVLGSTVDSVGYCSLYCWVLQGTTENWGALKGTRGTGGTARYCGVLQDTIGYWGYWMVLWGITVNGWYC